MQEFVQNKSFHPEISTFRNFRTGRNTFWWFLGMCTSLSKTAFPAQDHHVLSSSYWAHHLLAILSKVHEFVQNRCFQPEIITFCHFRTGRTTYYQFLAKCRGLYKTVFSARDQHVLSSSYWAHHLLAIFSKVHEFVQNRCFQPEISTFCEFCTGRTAY